MAAINSNHCGSAVGEPIAPPSGERNLPALTWSSVTAPSGTIVQVYNWIAIGKHVSLWFKVTATLPGASVTGVSFALPSDMPLPAIFSSQPNSSVVAYGTGTNGLCSLSKDSEGAFKISVIGTSISATFVSGTIIYLCA